MRGCLTIHNAYLERIAITGSLFLAVLVVV